MNMQESIERFRDYLATERRLAAGTVHNYVSDLEDLAAYVTALGVEELSDLDARAMCGPGRWSIWSEARRRRR